MSIKGKILILCPKCGLDRGKEVCGIGTPCPKCGFKPKKIDVVEEMDKIERRELLEEAKKEVKQ